MWFASSGMSLCGRGQLNGRRLIVGREDAVLDQGDLANENSTKLFSIGKQVPSALVHRDDSELHIQACVSLS